MKTRWYPALAVVFFSGCGIVSIEPEPNIEALARSWPPYQHPNYFVNGVPFAPESQPTAAGLPPAQFESAQSNTGQTRQNEAPKRPTPQWAFPPIRARESWDLEATVVDALGRIGSGAVPELIRELESDNLERQLQSAKILSRIGPDAKPAVATLTALLDHNNEELKKSVARALGQIGPAAENAVEPLLETLHQ